MKLKSKKSFLISGILFLIFSFISFLFYSVSVNNFEFNIKDLFTYNLLYESYNLILMALFFAIFWFSFMIISSLLLSYKDEKVYKISFFSFLVISSLFFLNNLTLMLIHSFSFLISIFSYSNDLKFKKSFKKVKVYVLLFSLLFSLFSLGYTFNNRDVVENALIDGMAEMAQSVLDSEDFISQVIDSDKDNILNYINEEDLPDGVSIEDLNNLEGKDIESMNIEGLSEDGSLDKDFIEDQISDIILSNELLKVIITFLPIVVAFIVFGSLMFLFLFVKIFTFITAGFLFFILKKVFILEDINKDSQQDLNENDNLNNHDLDSEDNFNNIEENLNNKNN